MSSENLFTVMYFVNAALALICLIVFECFLRCLKASQPKVHEALGEPSIFTNNTGLNTLRAVVFLFRRKYRHFSDDRLKLFGDFALATTAFVLVVGGATTLLSCLDI